MNDLFEADELAEQLSPQLLAQQSKREAARLARRDKAQSERDRVLEILANEPVSSVCGMDEVGRGPLAGPVTAAAVVLRADKTIHGLADSKQLSPAVRLALDPIIRSDALAWGLGWVWPDEIERLNIHKASLLAMRRAFATMLGLPPEKGQPQRVAPDGQDPGPLVIANHYRQRLLHAVADGKHPPDLSGLPWTGICLCLVKGDALNQAISAASIIAKVARDNWMDAYAAIDPRYGFNQHKGYGTPEHLAAIAEHGPCPIHRVSWLKT